ncbi:N-glycosylation protein-domain-containing protein [Amylocarpus encephaloides]|uniref:N-glycosylation protein-domain-containing protein n=1 Tax=Amylocarpus encephaloides TaxID=45428 RepID=A0A9P7YAC7_9HELO|nr:N-glycosylation protein-domain-containing protein [Amylocarpus encephaloides]
MVLGYVFNPSSPVSPVLFCPVHSSNPPLQSSPVLVSLKTASPVPTPRHLASQSSPIVAIPAPSAASSPSSPTSNATTRRHPPPDSVLHPRVAVLLGVEKHWHFPLLLCRALSTAPAAWWGLRCALTFLGELLLAAEQEVEAGNVGWSVERRFRVTEVFLAVLWCSASAYLSFFFTDCLMSRWLLNYTPQATLVRLLTINALNAYITSWVLYLSGGSEDPRLLLPAWISIASTLTFLYHLTHPRLAILKETSLSISVFSIASFISMVSLLLQLHLTRANDPPVPLFLIAGKCWGVVKLGIQMMRLIEDEL